MNRRDLAREEYQRANRHDPITGSGDPRGAQYQFETAAEMKRALLAEAQRRRPDAPAPKHKTASPNGPRPQAAYTIGHYLKNGAPPSPASAQSCAKSSSKQEKTPKCSLGCKASASPNTSPTNNGTRPSDKSSSGAPTRQVVMREDAQCSPRIRSCLLSFSYSLLHHILKDCDGTYQRY